MRNWINLIEDRYVDAGEEMAKKLVAKHGGKYRPYKTLPEGAKKSITHYMTVDGENDDYEELSYAYVEIPAEEFMNAYWYNIVTHVDPESKDSYPSSEDMYRHYRDDDPSKSVGFSGYNFSRHDLNEPWAVILGSDFFEDGAHRLAWYLYKGMEKIPVVMIGD